MQKSFQRGDIFLPVIAVILLAGVGAWYLYSQFRLDAGPEADQTSSVSRQFQNEVVIEGLSFLPFTATIKAGTTVTWGNKDTVSHQIESDTLEFSTGVIVRGANGKVTLNKPGVYKYHCRIHPFMAGEIVVVE